MPNTVALYARVSTADQTTDMQVSRLREYAAMRGWTVAKEYVDEGISGTVIKRPALNDLMLDAALRKFDGVVVWKFDRFARNLSHLIASLQCFKTYGIDFVSVTEAIDTSTPAGVMVFHIFGAVAQFERDLIRERCKAGMRAVKERLAREGSFRRNGRLITHIGRPVRRLNMEKIRAMIDEGLGSKTIAKRLKIPPQTMRDHLRKEGLLDEIKKKKAEADQKQMGTPGDATPNPGPQNVAGHNAGPSGTSEPADRPADEGPAVDHLEATPKPN